MQAIGDFGRGNGGGEAGVLSYRNRISLAHCPYMHTLSPPLLSTLMVSPITFVIVRQLTVRY